MKEKDLIFYISERKTDLSFSNIPPYSAYPNLDFIYSDPFMIDGNIYCIKVNYKYFDIDLIKLSNFGIYPNGYECEYPPQKILNSQLIEYFKLKLL